MRIWEAETCVSAYGVEAIVGGRGYELEGQLAMQCQVSALEWVQPGGGQLMLTVGCASGVTVFAPARLPPSPTDHPLPSAPSSTQAGAQDAYQAWNQAGGRMQQRKVALAGGGGGDGERWGESGGWVVVGQVEVGGQRLGVMTWTPRGQLVIGAGSQLWLASQWMTGGNRVEVLNDKSTSALMGRGGGAMKKVKSEDTSNGSESGRGRGVEGGGCLLGEAYAVGEAVVDYHPLLLFHYLCKGEHREGVK